MKPSTACLPLPWPPRRSHRAGAEGNLASQPPSGAAVLDANLNFSVKEYQIETGKYYRWEIKSDGGEEFLVKAPDLLRTAWINQVVINDIEVKPLGGIEGVEFDDEGSAVIWFVRAAARQVRLLCRRLRGARHDRQVRRQIDRPRQSSNFARGHAMRARDFRSRWRHLLAGALALAFAWPPPRRPRRPAPA